MNIDAARMGAKTRIWKALAQNEEEGGPKRADFSKSCRPGPTESHFAVDRKRLRSRLSGAPSRKGRTQGASGPAVSSTPRTARDDAAATERPLVPGRTPGDRSPAARLAFPRISPDTRRSRAAPTSPRAWALF